MRNPNRVLSAPTGIQREWRDSDDRLHRVGGPALECEDGSKAWYTHGIYAVGQCGLSWGGLGLPKLPGYRHTRTRTTHETPH